MNKIIIAAIYLTASITWAQDADESEVDETEKVDLRMSVIESIVVTADKTPLVVTSKLDEEIDAILDEAEALEDEESDE